MLLFNSTCAIEPNVLTSARRAVTYFHFTVPNSPAQTLMQIFNDIDLIMYKTFSFIHSFASGCLTFGQPCNKEFERKNKHHALLQVIIGQSNKYGVVKFQVHFIGNATSNPKMDIIKITIRCSPTFVIALPIFSCTFIILSPILSFVMRIHVRHNYSSVV